MTDQDDAVKAESIAAITAALEPLVGVIPGLLALKIHANIMHNDNNWDVVLVSEFDSVESLAAYQGHPAHVAAAATPRGLTSDRATVDYDDGLVGAKRLCSPPA